MFHLLADIDGNTIGLGAVSTALVTALGYMLRDRRDSDKRVDKATDQVVATVRDERDRALAAETAAYVARDEALEQLSIVRYRLQVAEAHLEALKGEQQ